MADILFIGADRPLTQDVIEQLHLAHPTASIRLMTSNLHHLPADLRHDYETVVCDPTDVLTMAQGMIDVKQVYISDAINATQWLQSLLAVVHHFDRPISRVIVSTLSISRQVAEITQKNIDSLRIFPAIRTLNIGFRYIHELHVTNVSGYTVEVFGAQSSILRQHVSHTDLPKFLSKQIVDGVSSFDLAN